ncbi:Zinc_finger domain-containing protein [Hexamita inflata]|uniref:Zinc finger domain-containing protein n=1 Tax=Hexamita inflata TaxID=28002 RepID=A0AA86QHF2_9EUKA|nr:Zinc finger domain-containing protein [Hexamita inflata]
MLLFTPSAHNKREQLKFLLSTKYTGYSYGALVNSDLKTSFKIGHIQSAFNELYQIKIKQQLQEPQYVLSNLNYVEPVLCIQTQEAIINRYSEQQACDLLRIINSKQLSHQFISQLLNYADLIQNLSSQAIPVSDLISCFRIGLLLDLKLDLNGKSPLLSKIYSLIYDVDQVKTIQAQKLSAKDKFQQLKKNKASAQESLLQTENSVKQEETKENNIQLDHICDLCHQEITDIIYFPCAQIQSAVDTNMYVTLGENVNTMRCCGHKFHQGCCRASCPVCRKYFGHYEKYHLTPATCVDEDIERINYNCKDIFNTMVSLASEPLIDDEDRKQNLNLYANEARVLLSCYAQIYKFHNLQFLYSIPDSYEEMLEKFRINMPSIISSDLKPSNFEYMQDIISNVTCVNCNQPFKLNVYREDSMNHCLKCGQYFHQNCDHQCVKLAYNFLDNLLFTNKYGMLGPYKNQFGGLQRSCVGPELFLDQKLLSQVVCYVITAEASLQRDENWVAYVAYSDEEEEENNEEED